MPETSALPTLAILGGTGKEGRGLALRWAHAGHPVVIGSRDAARAEEAAAAINTRLGREAVAGTGNREAAERADVAVLTVPYAAQRATIEDVQPALAGKILVDVTVPLVPPKVDRAQLPESGSAVLAIQKLLGAQVRVVSAFQHVSATHLDDLDHAIDCDVLICGDDEEAREVVAQLAEAAGMRGIHAGVLANSAAAEAMTSVLIAINKRYRVRGAGIRITGLPADIGSAHHSRP